MTKKTKKELKAMSAEEQLTYIFGEGAHQAILRNCKKRKIPFEKFLFNFIMDYADDGFADYLYELCEQYHIKMYEDEEEYDF